MSAYDTATTITAADLTEGDWIDTIPTQHGVRGIRLESIATDVTPDYDSWTARRGRGRSRATVTAVRITTRRGIVSIPATFTLTVRRPVAGVTA